MGSRRSRAGRARSFERSMRAVCADLFSSLDASDLQPAESSGIGDHFDSHDFSVLDRERKDDSRLSRRKGREGCRSVNENELRCIRMTYETLFDGSAIVRRFTRAEARRIVVHEKLGIRTEEGASQGYPRALQRERPRRFLAPYRFWRWSRAARCALGGLWNWFTCVRRGSTLQSTRPHPFTRIERIRRR